MDKVQQGINLIDSMTDDELNRLVDYIRAIYKTRKVQRNAKVRAELSIGSRVRIQGPTKPQYLANLTGTIESFSNTRVMVNLDCGPVGKYRDGKVLAPPSMLRVIG
jgi:hypothetical protein